MKSLINRLYRCTTTKVDEQVRRLARSLIIDCCIKSCMCVRASWSCDLLDELFIKINSRMTVFVCSSNVRVVHSAAKATE